MRLLLFISVGFLCLGSAWGQETFLSNNTPDERPTTYALTNGFIQVSPTTSYEGGTLVIKDGKVVAVGANITVPGDATVIDLEGKYVYPALVDPYTNYGLPEVKASRRRSGETPQYESSKANAVGWNEHNQSHYHAVEELEVDGKAADKYRSLGYGAVLSFRANGIMRGTSVLTHLGDGPVQEVIITPKAAAHFSFTRARDSKQLYPNSIMGMVAMLRQANLDATWYASSNDQFNATLDAFNSNKSLPQIFEANSDKLRVLLADKIGDEFGQQYIIKGNGDEYQRATEIAATNAPLILPLVFPDAYDVEDPLEAADVSLEMMKHWEMAPGNAAMLHKQGVRLAFTRSGLKSEKDFWPSLRKAIEHGLPAEEALRAITETPASILGASGRIGSLNVGRDANFFIATEDVLEGTGDVLQTWIQGERYIVKEESLDKFAGEFDLQLNGTQYEFAIENAKSLSGEITINDSTSVKVKVDVDQERIALSFNLPEEDNMTRLSGWTTVTGYGGLGVNSDGADIKWSANRKPGEAEEASEEQGEEEEKGTIEYGPMMYPFVAHGWIEEPTSESILIQNATVWTLDGQGKLEGADVLVQNGKVAQVGQGLSANGARVIDGTGKHLTPGIIDEHSHAGLSGVNESSQTIVPEVRMYDAVDSEQVDIYRQLAGGVTAAQLLHGSANPVGGQSALVKFRWGRTPEEMRIQGADGYIKFALGENVKQSNRSSEWTTRFPQTRMGVEQVFVDGFTRAKEYEAKWAAYRQASSRRNSQAIPPRRDLQLEALLEIINGERFITCHSYVQSEINMLMKVAEQFDFRVNTFTHILEGYKVADIMAKHGAGGSTFADWWAYKYEVKEAIPYNAALMTQAGVTSAINSDDREMARRLNQEAAKSVKYGDMDEVAALKLVTLNPAKLLHLDNRMGSIEVGKDADLVLWTDHPLSIYARADVTLVDGIEYYSMAKDQAAREFVASERQRLINKMLAVKSGGGKTQKGKKREQRDWHCEDEVINIQD